MNRGSEWRKWDLHIHTPGTAKNDKYGNSEDVWDKYIDALEKSDITVFGITDYFSMDNYYKVRQFQSQGRLKNKVILPNVELRITPVTKTGNAINIHAIFDPALSIDDIEREFFSSLKMQSCDATYSCTHKDLVAFGRKLAGDINYPEDAAVKKAIGEFVVPFQELHNILTKKFFDNRVIVALSGKSQDGLSGILNVDCNSHTLRQQIGRMADVILSSNAKDIAYFLGDGVDSKEQVIATYRSLKPCIIGSDAHSFDTVGVFPNDRITWIKADPTFEGLKQILFEPKERVRISDSMPDKKFDYNVIDYVELNTAGTWHQRILFNQNLNTIIGGRSTGKSTLLTSIAAKFQDIKNEENLNYIKGLCENIHVYWRDGQENNEKEIEFFTQNEIANIISKGESNKLFENILKSKIELREEYEKYRADEANLYSTIQSKVSLFFEKRRQYKEKIAYVKTLGDNEGIKKEIGKLAKERDEIQQKLTDKKGILDSYQAIEKELIQFTDQESVLKQEQSQLKILETSNFLTINPSVSYLGMVDENVKSISEKVNTILSDSNSQIQNFVHSLSIKIDEKLKILTRQISEKQNHTDYKDGKKIFNDNKHLTQVVKQIDSLSKQSLLIDKEVRILNELKNEFKGIAADLLENHLSYLDLMNSIASILRIRHDNIILSAGFELKNKLEETLNECLSLRSTAMNSLINSVVCQYQSKTKKNIKECLRDLLNKALKGEITFKNGYNVNTFISMILSNNWFALKYNAEYENDNLSDMSPGKRSFVVLKLLLDFSDKKCPILIDQPEDNLDNRAIYNELVTYIREKKKERQIILVTHNPSIVVGADSEEIIVANQNGKNAPNDKGIKFQYVYGSLEDSKARDENQGIPILSRCGIREHVCDILEGGENAFRDRENKYGFFKI